MRVGLYVDWQLAPSTPTPEHTFEDPGPLVLLTQNTPPDPDFVLNSEGLDV